MIIKNSFYLLLVALFAIKLGSELYSREVFGFEDKASALDVWSSWNASGNEDISIEIDETQGANGTSKCMKVTINNTGNESQLFTKLADKSNNAILEPNTAYIFSFYVKSPTLTSFNAVEVSNELKDSGGNDIQAYENYAWWSPVGGITSDWKHLTIYFTTSAMTQYSEGKAINTWTQFKFVPAATGILYIDEVSIFPNPNP